VLTLTVLVLGFLHGLGADHLIAIAALSAGPAGQQPPYARTVGIAVRFALGHALLLALGTTLVLVLGWNIPLMVERAGEMIGGLILVALGAVVMWMGLTRRLYVHSHPHAHLPNHTEHSHWHVHLGRQHQHPVPAGHSAVPGILGGVFAVSGLRALTLLAPFETVRTSMPGLLTLVVVFALGILLSMSIFGVVLARAMKSPRVTARVAEAAGLTTAVASVVLGLYWISGQWPVSGVR
jgi:nickel/cobalt transporter (NicO) family protein